MNQPKNSAGAMLFAVIAPLTFLSVLVFPASREMFQDITAAHPYILAFIKFTLLATTGEILAGKIVSGAFFFPRNAAAKAAIWGIIGMMIALMFPMYSAGILAAQDAGMLIGKGNAVVTAIISSIANNLTFGLSMMRAHRVTDTMLELRSDGKDAAVLDAVRAVDWAGFVSFVAFRTMPLFWIPAHTITFLLPTQYRVILSAFLSIALGLLLAIGRKKSMKSTGVIA